MKRLILYCLLFLVSGCKTTAERTSSLDFYGKDNQSAELSYESFVETELPPGVTTVDQFLDPGNSDFIMNLIKFQIQHSFSSFTNHSGYADTPGIIAAKSDPVVLGAEIDLPRNVAKVKYKYSDKAVFHKKLIERSNGNISFVLPKNPTTIYQKGFSPNSPKNKCTDQHYNSEGDFWYFWDPEYRGCPIKKDDLVEISAVITPIPSTEDTYPAYDAIFGRGPDKKTVKITYIVGIDETFSSGDLGAKAFMMSLSLLQEQGFTLAGSPVMHQGIVSYQKLEYKKRAYNVELDLYLSDPGTSDFLKTAAEAMESDDIFMYDGHSGLGGYLDIKSLNWALGRDLKLPNDKSQIFFMNGCSTYAYYNDSFFNLKKSAADPSGAINLDIVTTAVGAAFDIGAKQGVSFIMSLVDGSRPKWKLIIDRLYRVEPTLSSLLQVNGDEGNPTVPRLTH